MYSYYLSLREIATPNVGSMTEKERELVDMMQLREVDMGFVQETKWNGGTA